MKVQKTFVTLFKFKENIIRSGLSFNHTIFNSYP